MASSFGLWSGLGKHIQHGFWVPEVPCRNMLWGPGFPLYLLFEYIVFLSSISFSNLDLVCL